MIEIDGYTAIERIGQGGLGDVYRATRRSTGGLVAVKVLRDVSDESVAWHRTRRELTALVALAGHANVIQLIELLELREGPALVMEYAPGGSVAELVLRRDTPLSVPETILIGRQTAAALVAAHAQGIVHRDVKPQNLLIDAYGQVKLCDFGIAAIARATEFQVRTSALSMRYASPEDLDDDEHVGSPADVYSLGATLLHLVHGAPPTLKERLAPWQPPADAAPDVAAVDAVIAACLRPEPAVRPTAAEVLDELEHLDRFADDRSRSLVADVADVADVAEVAEVAEVADVAELRPEPSSPTTSLPPGGGDAAASPAAGLDETFVRPDRRVAVRPSASPPTSGRGRRVALGAAVVVGVAVAVVVAGVLARPGGDVRSPGRVALVERPADLTSITSIDWPQGEVGECLVRRGAVLATVGCDEPHDLQRVGIGDLDAVETVPEEFDEAAIGSTVAAICAAERDRFVAGVDGAVELDAPFTVPTATTWASGDRRYECWVGAADHRIVGSVVP